MLESRGITIVLPMLNEQDAAEDVATGLLRAFADIRTELTVVCVNDGSSDRTQSILDNLARRHSNVRVETHDSRRGYGAAIRTGLDQAATPLVGWMDADGQYDPVNFMCLLGAIEAGAVAAIGVRNGRADPRYRSVLGTAGSFLASLICRHRLADVDAGIKVLDRTVVDLEDLRSNGGYISTEVLLRSYAVGRVEQIPVSHHRRLHGKQTGASLRVLFGLATDFRRVRIKHH